MNYGGIIQAYALIQTLKNLGHEPELLYIKSTEKRNWKWLVKKYILSNFLKKYNSVKYEDKIYIHLYDFIDKYIKKTDPLNTTKDFVNITKNNYEAYIVGSDQVWRARTFSQINHAFFGFVSSNQPIFLSYAASFGVQNWDYTVEETLKFREQIKRFKAVSVREDSAVPLCMKYFNKDAIHVLDPTMLLAASEYRELVRRENEPKHNGKLLNYILDNNKQKKELIDLVSSELNIQPFKVNADVSSSWRVKDMIYPTLTSWLKGFDDAEYVITDSFHGCVFSIIFNKKFIAWGNSRRGLARFKSLLKLFGLEDRLILGESDISLERVKAKIDWSSVNEKLELLKDNSISFLSENLK